MKKTIKTAATAFLCLLLAAAAALTLCSCDELFEYFNSDLSIEENDEPTPMLTSHFLDVGQGDSIFIELPDGRTMLIDGGITDMGDSIVEKIRSLGHEKIDIVVATHPHSDHIGGLRKVINQFDIGEVYMPKAETDTYNYEKLLKAVKNKGLKIKTAKSGVNIANAAEPEYRIDILAPVKTYEDLNDSSAVIKITFRDVSLLYMGDAEEPSERDILASGADVSADIVKVGHHGSYKASSEKFVKAVGADHGIISCGEGNDYGHPHKKAMDRWEKAGTKLWRTDLCGDITVTTDGSSYHIDAEKGEVQ